jgi:CRP-like cAMP-binding protein
VANSDAPSAAIARQIFLRSFSAGKPAGSAATYLAQVMRDEVFPAGTELYRKGDAADDLFFIVSGRVRQSVKGAPSWEFEGGAVIGLLDVLQERLHARTAEAATDVHALVLKADDYFDVLEDHFEFTRSSILSMADALHALRLTLPPTGGFGELRRSRLPESRRGPPSSRRARSLSARPLAEAEVEDRPLNVVERTIALRGAPALREASIQALTSMAELIDELRPAPGDVLVSEGAVAPAIFLVARGLVGIERREPAIAATFGPGALVGGYASLGWSVEAYTARALAPSLLFSIDKEDLFDLLELHFDLTRSVLKNMAAERESALLEEAAR